MSLTPEQRQALSQRYQQKLPPTPAPPKAPVVEGEKEEVVEAVTLPVEAPKPIAPVEAPKPSVKPAVPLDIGKFTQEEKARRDRAAGSGALRGRRDEIVDAMYKTKGKDFGFSAGTDADKTAFVDYVINDFVENNNVNTFIASPVARDFLNYETLVRYGGTINAKGLKYEAQQNLLKAHQENKKIAQKRTQVTENVKASLVKRESPDAQLVTVVEDGEVSASMPYWEKHRGNEIEKQISTMYTGTLEGNLSGIKLDLDEYKAAQDLVLSDNVYSDPDDPERLAERRKQIEQGRVITTFKRGEKVPQRRIVLPQILLSNGQYAVDLDAIAFDLSQKYLVDEARAKGHKYVSQLAAELGRAAMGDLRKKKLAEARERMQEVQLQSLGSVVFLRNSRKTAEKLAQGEDFLGRYSPSLMFAGLLDEISPREGETRRGALARMQAPWKRVLYPQSTEAMNQGTLYYGRRLEQLGDTKLNWLLEFGPYAPIGSYATAPEDVKWGSAEHLMRQGKGYNIFEDSALRKNLEKMTGSSGGALAGLVALTLFEPSLIDAILLPFKVGGVGVKLAAKGITGIDQASDIVVGAKVKRSVQQLRNLELQLAEAEKADDLDAAIKAIRELEAPKEAKQLAQAKTAAVFGVKGGSDYDIGPALSNMARESLGEIQKLEAAGVRGGTKEAFAKQSQREIDKVLGTVAKKLDEAKVPEAVRKRHLDQLRGDLARYQIAKLESFQVERNLVHAAETSGENLRRGAAGKVSPESISEMARGVKDAIKVTRKGAADFRTAENKLTDLSRLLKQASDAGKTTRVKELTRQIRSARTEMEVARQTMQPGLRRASITDALYNYNENANALRKATLGINTALKTADVSRNVLDLKVLDTLASNQTNLLRFQNRTSQRVIAKLREEVASLRDSYSQYGKFLSMTPHQKGILLGESTDVSLTPYLQAHKTSTVGGPSRRFSFKAREWQEDLHQKFGKEKVAEQLDRLNQTPEGMLLSKRLRSDGRKGRPSLISTEEVATLKKIVAPLAEAERRVALAPLELAEVMLRAWREKLLTPAGVPKLGALLRTPEEWAAYGAEWIRDKGSIVDARRGRVGRWKSNIQNNIRQTVIRGDDTGDVVTYLLGKLPKDDADLTFPTEVFRVLDTQENLSIGNRVIATNKYNDFTIFQNFKAYIRDAVQGMSKEERSAFLMGDRAMQGVTRAYLPSITPASGIIADLTEDVYLRLLGSDSAEDFAGQLKSGTSAAFRKKDRVINVNEVTRKLPGGEEYRPDYKALTWMLRGMLGGQNRHLFNQGLDRALGPAMTPAAAQKANFVLQMATDGDAAIEKLLTQGNIGFDASEAIQAIEEWGATFNKDVMNEVCSSMKAANNATMEFQRVGRNALGESIFAAAPAIKQIELHLDDAIKTLEGAPSLSRLNKEQTSRVKEMLQMWRTSVTRGYFTPRPRYFANQMAGDFAQLLMSEGLLTLRRQKTGPRAGALYLSGALPMSFQNAFTYVPYFGPKITATLEDLGETAAKAGVPSLTTPLNAWVNPFVQRILTNRHSDEAYAVIDGQMTASQLVAEMSQRNVFDALFSEDMRKVAQDLTDAIKRKPEKFGPIWKKKGKKTLTAWRDYSEVLVRQTQDHQRAALYLEYRLRRGATADEAQKAVEAALYDWRHGVSKWEMDKLTVLGAFYPYFRLSMQQMGSAVMESLTYNVKDTVKYSILGTGRLNRARKGGQAIFGLPAWVNGNDGEDLGYAEAIQLADSRSKPSFYGASPILMSQITPEGKMALTIGPSFGIPETLDIYMSLLEGVVGTAAMMHFPGTEDLILGEEFSREIYENVIQDQFNPLARDVSKYALDAYNGTTPRSMVNLPKKYNFLIENRVPFLKEMVVPGKYGYEMPRGYKDFAEAIPILGTELPRAVGILEAANATIAQRAEWDQGTLKGMLWMLGDLTGLTQESVGMTPTEARDMIARRISGDAIRELKAGESRVKGTEEFLDTD